MGEAFGLKVLLDEYERTRECGEFGDDAGDLINMNTDKGWNCIHYACYLGHSEIVKILLSYGSNCNKETGDDWTPLQLGCYKGHVDTV